MSLLESMGHSPVSGRKGLHFVSIGEAMVEMSPAATPATFAMGFAGDTLNTAWYAKALRPHWDSRFVSRVGTDAASDQMLSLLQGAGINTEHLLRSEDRTLGLYLISLNNGERSFSYWRGQSAAKQLADDPAALRAATQDADLIYFSGITMGILDRAGRKTLLDTVAQARSEGILTAFDSNLRPRLWSSPSEMTDTIMQASAVADIVLPSYDDEAEHFGDASIEATCERYLAAGCKTVVVKNGPGSVLYSHQGQKGTVAPPKVTSIVDTTAAGDSFNAGFFTALETAETMEDAILAASNVAGQVIGQKGALVPLKAQS